MALNFPSSPTDGQYFEGWIYNAATPAWERAAHVPLGGSQFIVRNLIRNARFRVNQRAWSSGSSIANLAYFLDGWLQFSGGSTTLITATGSDDAGRVLSIGNASLERPIRQKIEQRDVVPGTYIFGQFGTAYLRVYKSGDTPPGYAPSGTVVLDGTGDVWVDIANPSGASATVDRPYLMQATSWPGYFPDISYREDLAWCQRYYYRMTAAAAGATAFAVGFMSSTTNLTCVMWYPVTMCATPTLGGTAAASLQVRTAATLSVSAYAMGTSATPYLAYIDVTTSAGTAGQAGVFRATASGQYLEFIADL